MIKKMTYALALIAAIGSVTAFATKSHSPISSEIKAFVVLKNAAGEEKLASLKSAEPGQTIQYNLTYKNSGEGALKNLTVTGPIPANTHFLANSTTTKVESSLVVSIDGGKTYEKEPVKRLQVTADGKKQWVVIPADQYTHVRWNTKDTLRSGGRQIFGYRVRVN